LIAAGLHGAEDEVKPLVGIVLIQANLKIRRLSVIGEIHCTPFNVKDAIRRRARHGSKDATAAGKVCTPLAHDVCAIIAPETKNRVSKRALIVRSGQTS
jgi:hypothetical protein